MKRYRLTESKLRNIIKETIQSVLNENESGANVEHLNQICDDFMFGGYISSKNIDFIESLIDTENGWSDYFDPGVIQNYLLNEYNDEPLWWVCLRDYLIKFRKEDPTKVSMMKKLLPPSY